MDTVRFGRENAVPFGARSAMKQKESLVGRTPMKNSTAKKNVLGDLNNLMNKKMSATPMGKSVHMHTELLSNGAKTLCTDVVRQQKRKHNLFGAPRSLEQKLNKCQPPETTKKQFPTVDHDAYDYMDFPSVTCTSNCKKGISELWSEELIPDKDMINNVLNGLYVDNANETPAVKTNFHDEMEKFDVFNDSAIELPEIDDVGEKNDFKFTLPPPPLFLD